MVGVIIIIVVFDAQAAGRAARRAVIGPERAKARIIAATYSAACVQDATTSRSDDSREALRRAEVIHERLQWTPRSRKQKAAPKDRFIRFNFPKREIGAGEEIRTLDPNLGKVVLYH